VDSGYIVYVGVSEDPLLDQARFKAEGQAIEDLQNECSFAPKGARVEDHYETVATTDHGMVHQAYSKVAVDFLSCEQAKSANQPDDIRKLANVSMAEEVKRYQTLVDEPPPEALEEGEGEAAAPPQSGGGNTPPPRTVVVVHDEPGFFIVRQQVAYYKQVYILPPPPGAPPPPPPAQAAAALAAPTQQLQTYEQSHPEVKTTPHTWSQVRPPEYRPQFRQANRMRVSNPARANNGFRPRPQQRPNPKQEPPHKGKRKKKRDEH
jgi:hypothetical protein